MKFRIFAILSFSILFISCNKNRFRIDTSDVDLNIKIERFDQDFMSIDTLNIDNSILELKKKYGEFFSIYTNNVIMLGDPNANNYKELIKTFVTDSLVGEVYNETQHVFADITPIQTEVNNAFKYIKHYFPEKNIPRIATHISGFNQNIVISKDILSISLDNYLGADCALYKGIVYDYALYNMNPNKVAPDIILGYLMSEFRTENTGKLLDIIISKGKILYLQSVCMQERPEQDIIGYTKAQYDWCVTNEQNMWNYLVENKQLFSTSQLVISKYVNPAPFTTYFTQDSPGQATIWLGLQIVKNYMENNTSVSLKDLMADTNYQRILEESKYKP